MSKSLFNPNGLKISELVRYLQAEYLERGLDGEIWIANTNNAGLTNQMAEAVQLNQSDVCFDIRRDEADLNPCLEIYRRGKEETQYLCAETIEAIERMRK